MELKGIKNDGSNPGSRMRDAQTTYKLGNVHEDLFFVATTASAVGLHGLDYISVKYSLGSAQANKTFTVWAFAWDSAYGTANDPDMDDYAAWGVVNPSTNGGYLDAGNANVPVLGRHLMQGPKQNDPNVNWDTYMSAFDVTADGTGVITVYGWFDGGWQGSYHMPISGIVLLPEPTTVALLGLGGLALLRRRK
ncbi:MAG: PEP-CTERM sorting domain-containing protein [Sedimentisphaerales bacterium]|nr:PEP-CTERM sorting domain-containing protein [Sedimentisphaerales bacterium]